MGDHKRRALRIGVVGGGIGGFAVGVALKALKEKGVEVMIFERDQTFSQRKQGYGLTMQQGGIALRELNLLEAVKREDTPSTSHYVFAADGNIVGFFGRIFYEEEGQKPKKKNRYNLHLPRQRLRELLYEQIDDGVIQWGKKFTGFEIDRDDSDGCVALKFGDGSVHKADVLVGADGIYSAVRTQIVGDSLEYLGVLVVLGIVDCIHPLCLERTFQTVDGCTRIFTMPFTIGEKPQTMWQLSFPLDEAPATALSKDMAKLKAYVVDLCKDWHDPIPALLSNTSLDLISGTPVFDRGLLEPEKLWKLRPGDTPVTLIGDAAHPMSPFKGQGANQALLDAILFASHIYKSFRDDRDDALMAQMKDYERTMLDRSKSKVLGSRAAVTNLHKETVLSVDALASRGRGISAIVAKLRELNVGSWSADTLDATVTATLRLIEERQDQEGNDETAEGNPE